MKHGSKGTEKEKTKFESLSLKAINKEIEAALYWARNGGSTTGRKAFFKNAYLA